jgi:5-formyltetrahydrofolate cyclo-ligase
VDLFVVPGLAFDPERLRLGRGGGYYDRLLALARHGEAALVGVALERWLADALPREPHDVAMTIVVTEARVL